MIKSEIIYKNEISYIETEYFKILLNNYLDSLSDTERIVRLLHIVKLDTPKSIKKQINFNLNRKIKSIKRIGNILLFYFSSQEQRPIGIVLNGKPIISLTSKEEINLIGPSFYFMLDNDKIISLSNLGDKSKVVIPNSFKYNKMFSERKTNIKMKLAILKLNILKYY